MAKPTYYPDWATQNTTLPATGQANKVRPRQTIRDIGWDKGQIPTAEEMNWLLNNNGLWIHYLVDEVLPTLPNTYLPKTGTSITLAGDATGTATWNGTNGVTLSVTVLDNSHKHLSADITDAAQGPVANVIVKRDSRAAISAGDISACATEPADQATFFLLTQGGTEIGQLSGDQSTGGNIFLIRRNLSTGAVASGVYLYEEGHVDLTYPRSNTAQEGQPNSLLRYDYFVNQVNSINNAINTNAANAANTFISGIRQSSEIGVANSGFTDYSSGRRAEAPGGAYITALADVSTGKAYLEDIDVIWYKYLQYQINGNWYNIGSL